MMVKDGVGMVFASIRKEDERVPAPGRMLGKYIGPGESNYTKYDAKVTERTQQWLAESADRDQPWCLYVGLVAPHFPLVCPQEFYDMYPADSLPDPKLHPSTGYERHPWVELQSVFDSSDAKFTSADERKAAMSAYYGLISWLDYNIGRILEALEASGQLDNTTIVYTSDHGDNVGARGLWGKSNMYDEAAAIPLIMAGPEVREGTCETPVSLLDLSETIIDHFDADLDGDRPGTSLYALADAPTDPDRIVFSEYHAIGAVSAAYMVRKGRWKLIDYVGFDPELFNLETDPEEMRNLAQDPDYSDVLAKLQNELSQICDPVKTDAQAHSDQADLVERYGGKEKAFRETAGLGGGTPPPADIVGA